MLFLLKKSRKGSEKRNTGFVEAQPALTVKRLVINGKEHLVRRVIAVNDNVIVFEDMHGVIHAVPIQPQQKEGAGVAGGSRPVLV